MGPCGLQSLKYQLFGPFQMLYPHPVTNFQLQALTSRAPSVLCSLHGGLTALRRDTEQRLQGERLAQCGSLSGSPF